MSTLDDIFGHDETQTSFNNINLLDLSNILHSTYHAQVRFDRSLNNDMEKYAMWRFLILNSILNMKNKLQPDELVICVDSHSWRKKAFQYYKANRVLAREKQEDFNYEEFIEVSNGFIDELAEFFPYKVIKVEGAEADDVIAVLTQHLQGKNITIISRDKDFKQLLRSPNIRMFDPIDKKFKTVECPYAYLMEHILKGDTSDGIPNMLSDDNTFVITGKRQTPITKKKLEAIHELGIEEFAIQNNAIKKYERNKKLVELSKDEIPENIWNNVIYEYNQQTPKGDYMKIVQFLRKHKIRSLTEKANMFMY